MNFKVALVGNPNCGKSTIFNQLTGLRQKTGNFPGITVDIKKGEIRLPRSGYTATIFDLPGTYSLHPTSSDERIVTATLTDLHSEQYPDALIYIADATHLEKHLLLLTQLSDLQLPVICVLNMADVAAEKGIQINQTLLSEKLGVPVVLVSARTGENIPSVLFELEKLLTSTKTNGKKAFYQYSEVEKQIFEAVRLNLGVDAPYLALLLAHHYEWLPQLKEEERQTLAAIVQTKNFQSLRAQVDETLARFEIFTPIVRAGIKTPPPFPETITDKMDNVLTHRFFGPAIFFGVMLLIFQAIYDWSKIPMDFIEGLFNSLGNLLKKILPEAWYTDLLTDGVLAGLSGILVFVPQIFILFLLITILEEVGYMARVVFMFDKMMRRFGMNGRSVVALISGGACAVPAIMSARTIGNWRERLVTVMVTPFISCSARIPVYAVLIGMAVPNIRVAGLNLQGIVFGGMYLLGVLAAFGSGWVMKKILRTREMSFLAIELPVYRKPHWKNVWLTVWEKTGSFVIGAGKIILIISIFLWAMASFGPSGKLLQAEKEALQLAENQQLDSVLTADLVAAKKLEASWAGVLGKTLEPAIRPLGYDWKIGIALITSFAAREVFVGTMYTIYSIGSSKDDEKLLREKMNLATFSDTGKPVYTLATALSLLVFYALAMQCMSTLAVVRRETGSWKWPLLQFSVMGLMAWVGAWMVYQILS